MDMDTFLWVRELSMTLFCWVGQTALRCLLVECLSNICSGKQEFMAFWP